MGGNLSGRSELIGRSLRHGDAAHGGFVAELAGKDVVHAVALEQLALDQAAQVAACRLSRGRSIRRATVPARAGWPISSKKIAVVKTCCSVMSEPL